jgi:Amt family ammonium transporter
MLIYFAWGGAIEGSVGGPYFGVGLGTFLRYVPWTNTSSAAALLPILSVALSAMIPLGSAADRWRLSGACLSTVVFAGIIYPLFARWAAHAEIFASPAHGLVFPYASTFLLDAGGSARIHATGGLAALSLSWLLGPRSGKYSSQGMPAAIPAHNGVFVLFGCMLAWMGWLGLNATGAMLHLPPGLAAERMVLIILNTGFAAAAAALAAAATTRVRFRRPDASLIANGWMAGLVAGSAGCATLKPATAILTGLVAGFIVVVSVEFFELHLKVDDPCGSISVHAVGGLWGLLAAGIFSGSSAQFMAQLVGIATLLGLIFPMTYGLNWVLSRFIPYRVAIDGERQGLDLHELGADAYPEFVVHADEFLQR